MTAPHRDPKPSDDDAHLRRPRIVLSAADRAHLQAIALNALLANPRVAWPAARGNRSRRAPADDVQAPERVSLGSWVKYRDAGRRETRKVRIVETARPDSDLELCVLSPLGVALMGMAAGQSIIASDRRGSEWLLQVLDVTRPRDEAP
jgi:regulator of nucleoside diphosphate kinase